MRQPSPLLWFSLCLSSLLITLSLVTGTAVRASQNVKNQEIAQVNPCASANPCAAKVGRGVV